MSQGGYEVHRGSIKPDLKAMNKKFHPEAAKCFKIVLRYIGLSYCFNVTDDHMAAPHMQPCRHETGQLSNFKMQFLAHQASDASRWVSFAESSSS